jgi:hypothetical protein
MSNCLYEALDPVGFPYLRPPTIINELSHSQRLLELETASQALAAKVSLTMITKANYGRPIYTAFGLTRKQAKKHEYSELLLKLGSDLPITT